ENAKKFNAVKEKFDSYFIKRRNTIFERAKFNTRKQEVGESVVSFITDLYCLAKYCNYGALNDEMIRDRIIVAKEATCLKCKKKGHYQAVCRSERGTVNSLDDNDSYLGAVYSKEINSVAANPWKVVIAVNEIKIEFKLDTGADVSVIPETEFKKLNIELKNTSKILTGPSQQNLNVRGSFSARLDSDKEKTEQEVYVVRGLRFPLLGRPAIEALNLVSLVQPIQSTPEEIYQKFPKLFEGLG
ncbi:hypothetical protein QZH41_017106, partial [Actinostola sp. cb2023]